MSGLEVRWRRGSECRVDCLLQTGAVGRTPGLPSMRLGLGPPGMPRLQPRVPLQMQQHRAARARPPPSPCHSAGGCIILPGVTVGEGATVAGGAVVAKDVEPYTVVRGAAGGEQQLGCGQRAPGAAQLVAARRARHWLQASVPGQRALLGRSSEARKSHPKPASLALAGPGRDSAACQPGWGPGRCPCGPTCPAPRTRRAGGRQSGPGDQAAAARGGPRRAPRLRRGASLAPGVLQAGCVHSRRLAGTPHMRVDQPWTGR